MDDFDYSALSDDPELAFVELEKHFRKHLHAELNDSQSGDYTQTLYIEYINHTLAAARSLGLDFLREWDIPTLKTRDLYDRYHDFTTVVASITLQINISHARSHKKYSVALTAADKQRVRHYVEQIKLVLDNVVIPVSKKDDLYRKLNVFLAEIDKIRTSLETFGDIAVGLAHIGGDVAKELEPARKWVDSIARLFGRYRDMEDAQRQLPKPEDRLRIEPPKLQISDQSEASKPTPDLDDEIPF
jgi:hypothetical protein